MTKPAKQSTPQLRFLQEGELPTQKEISEWKEKYGDVFLLQEEVEADLDLSLEESDIISDEPVGEVLVYLRKPSRKVIKFVSQKSQRENADAIRFTELMLQNVWLAGHEQILKDNGLLMSVGNKLEELIGIRSMELKKL